jgi:hypothetical protein
MEPAQEDLTLYNGDNMRDSVVHSRLVSLSWAPIGSPSTLLSATRRVITESLELMQNLLTSLQN